MKVVLAALFACGCVNLAEADDRPFTSDWEVYRTFLNEPSCGIAIDQNKCTEALDQWRRDFKWATDPDWKHQLVGQQNLAVCLRTGCSGTVKMNPVLACAWAHVIVLSGNPQIGSMNFQFEREACGALSVPIENEAAKAQAQRLRKMLNPSH